MLKKLFHGGTKITDPIEFTHQIHIDKDLNWSFDESLDPKTVFIKLKVIGKGGFGTVSQIAHIPSMTILAGKLINSNLVNESSKLELEHEIQLMREVDSPYTVRYYGSVAYEGTLMILMEYCDKGSLRDILDKREQVLSEDQISLVMHDLLMGLNLIHKKHRIVHRDIKAANLLLTSKGDIKIADFGVSRRFEASGTCHTMSMVGTPYWMAPEVISGISYSFPADIWSVGVTAIELAEGSPPYVEFAPTKAMIEIAVKGFPGYRFPTMHSPEFCDFVSHCLETNPNNRWTIDELLEHQFIKRAERLNRMEVLADLLDDFSCDSDRKLSSNDQSDMDSISFGESSNDNNYISDGLSSARNITISDNYASFEGTAMMMSRRFNSSLSINSPFEQGINRGGNDFDTSNVNFVSDSSDLRSGNNYISFRENSINSFSTQQSAMDSFNMGSNSPFLQDNNNVDSFMLENNSNFMSNDDDEISFKSLPMDSFNMNNSPFPHNDNNNVDSFMLENNENISNELSENIQQKENNIPQQTEENQQNSVPKTVRFSNTLNTRNSAQTISVNNLPDKLFVKVSRVMSNKIPFIPIKIGSNNDAEVDTLYQKPNTTFTNLKSKKELFDNDGIINPIGALYSKKFYYSFALVILFLTFFFIKRNGFIGLIGLCYLTVIFKILFKKDKRKQDKDNSK